VPRRLAIEKLESAAAYQVNAFAHTFESVQPGRQIVAVSDEKRPLKAGIKRRIDQSSHIQVVIALIQCQNPALHEPITMR
jgi:hypothetical protein